MITPGYSLTSTERVLPRLALDFTTAVADARVTTTRAANTATRFNASGLIEIVNANLPRFDFSPTTLTCRGQLIEEARTNLFLNSLIDGTNLATQSVTLSAVAYRLSFYGSGSIVISGGHSATVAGVGDFPNRTTYAFTPTAGSSTFTVSGDVKFAQLEAGTFVTSFIPTAATSVLRNADVVTMTGTNFSNWYNLTEGTFAVWFSRYIGSNGELLGIGDTLFANTLRVGVVSTNEIARGIGIGFANPVQVAGFTGVTSGKLVLGIKQNGYVGACNGAAVSQDTVSSLPSVNPTTLEIGRSYLLNQYSGHIQEILYWPQRLINSEVSAFSK